MARFNPSPDPTNDPNYLGYSKEYDKPKADTSLGSLFGDLGQTAGAAIKATDNLFQEKIRNELYEQIDAVRAQHGADMTPDEIPAIAGTGARGAKYAAAKEAGLPLDDDGPEKTVPAGVNQRVDGLRRMTKAYQAGQLSESYYYAQLESIVSQMRQRYPGYREQIDGMVSQITGVTPANALRKSLLTDMHSLAAQAGAANRADESWYARDQEWIGMLWPGKDKNWAIQNRQMLEGVIAQKKGQQLDLRFQDAQLTNESKNNDNARQRAVRIVTDAVNQEVSNFITGQLNVHGATMRDLEQQVTAEVRKGAAADPEKIEQLRNTFAAIKAGIQQKVDTRLNNGEFPNATRLLQPGQRSEIVKTALTQLDGLEKMLGGNEFGLAGMHSRILKTQNDRDVLVAFKNQPALRELNVIREAAGPEVANAMLSSRIGNEVKKGILERSLLEVANPKGPKPPPVSTIMDRGRNNDAVGDIPTDYSRATVDSLLKMAQSKDPEVAFRAVESLYKDDRFFPEVPAKQKLMIYEKMGSPDFTAKMATLGKSKPQAWADYRKWMEEAHPVVFKQAADDFQTALTYNRYNVEFNPETLKFSIETKPEFRSQTRTMTGETDPAQRYADRINRSAELIKPVLEAEYGKEAPARFVRLLERAGVNFSETESKGTFLEELGKAVSKKVGEMFDDRFQGDRPVDAPKGKKSVPAKDLGSQKQRAGESATIIDWAFAQRISESVRVNPEKWEAFIKNARQSTNIEDRRGDKPDPQLEQEALTELISELFRN